MTRSDDLSSPPRVLILGGTGMLGHQLWQACRQRFDTYATVRSMERTAFRSVLGDTNHVIEGVTADRFDSVIEAVANIRPQVIVNCIGIVKQQRLGHDPLASLTVNALFPHQLSRLCRACGARLIHISTDCVFSGRRGRYTEADMPDPEDLYGRTKLLGEVGDGGCLTLRTSMIGRELATSHGLIEWFLSRQGSQAPGYNQAIFSGLTTQALASVIVNVIADHPTLEGLWHVAAEPIAKFDLLVLIRDRLSLEIHLVPDDRVVIDRSLDASRFTQATGWSPPSWIEMIEELAHDSTPYDDLRRNDAHR